jgi:hypothetical protein
LPLQYIWHVCGSWRLGIPASELSGCPPPFFGFFLRRSDSKGQADAIVPQGVIRDAMLGPGQKRVGVGKERPGAHDV